MIPSPESLARAKAIIDEIAQLQSELASLFGGSAPAPAKRRGRPPGPAKSAKSAAAAPAEGKRKRLMSPEGRARIAAATKARWARFRADQRKASKEG